MAEGNKGRQLPDGKPIVPSSTYGKEDVQNKPRTFSFKKFDNTVQVR